MQYLRMFNSTFASETNKPVGVTGLTPWVYAHYWAWKNSNTVIMIPADGASQATRAKTPR